MSLLSFALRMLGFSLRHCSFAGQHHLKTKQGLIHSSYTMSNTSFKTQLYNNSTKFFFMALRPKVSSGLHVLKFLDHKQRRSNVGRTSLDKWAACCEDLYLKNTIPTTDTHPCTRRDSNPQSQKKESSLRPTPYTVRPLAPSARCGATWVHYDAKLVKHKSIKILRLYKTRVSFLEWHFSSLQ